MSRPDRPGSPRDRIVGVERGEVELRPLGHAVEHHRAERCRLGEDHREPHGSRHRPWSGATQPQRPARVRPPCAGRGAPRPEEGLRDRVVARPVRAPPCRLSSRGLARATTRPPGAPRGRRVAPRTPRRRVRAPMPPRLRHRAGAAGPRPRATRALLAPGRATARASRAVAARHGAGTHAAARPGGSRPGLRACGRGRVPPERCLLRQQRAVVPRGRSPRSPRTTCRTGARARREPAGR